MAAKTLPETWQETVDIVKTSAQEDGKCDKTYACDSNKDGRVI